MRRTAGGTVAEVHPSASVAAAAGGGGDTTAGAGGGGYRSAPEAAAVGPCACSAQLGSL